jgi:hypothetical protein
MKILEHNIETGEAIERDATADELAQMEIDAAKFEAEEQARLDKESAKVALLAKLGIDEDEAKLLLG